jgi:hypothetical protein
MTRYPRLRSVRGPRAARVVSLGASRGSYQFSAIVAWTVLNQPVRRVNVLMGGMK